MALKDELAKKDTNAKLVLSFTVVDPIFGSLEFWLGDLGFTLPTAKVVYPAVLSWGTFREMIPVDGKFRDAEFSIVVNVAAVITAMNGARMSVADLLRYRPMQDVAMTIHQWNRYPTGFFSNPTALWSGYYLGIGEISLDNGKQVASLRLGAREVSKNNLFISDIITKSAFAAAPEDSLGKMVPRVYGRFISEVDPVNEVTPPISAVMLGYGVRAVEGVVVDEQQTLRQTKVRFAKNDSSKAWALDPLVMAYIPEANTFAWIDPGSYSLTSNTVEVSVLVTATPNIHVVGKLGKKGTKSKAAFDANTWKVFDGDPTNFIETTSTDFEISFELAPISISGFTVTYLVGWVHVTCTSVFPSTRTFEVGIWNPFNTGAAGWLGNAGKRDTGIVVHSTQAKVGGLSSQYVASDFKANVGATTVAEFIQGTFCGKDSNDAAQAIEMYLNVTSASKDLVRIHGMNVRAYGTIGLDKITRATRSSRRIKTYDPQGRFKGWKEIEDTVYTEEAVFGGQRKLAFIGSGIGQRDTGTTYEGDAADDPIRNGAGIAHHLLDKIAGMPVNTTASTLGNFTDAKVEDVAGEKNIDIPFGPESQFTIEDALEGLMRNHSLRTWREEGIWHCVYDEMNPHSSRFYRSTAEEVRISGRRHILPGSLKVTQLPYDRILNRATVNYGHVFGTGRALGTHSYDNPLSQDLFGLRTELVSEEKWITADVIGVVPEAAKFRAKYLGRIQGRPRQTVVVGLAMAFHDLQRGHVLQFDDDMESIDLQSIAYRCGRFNYAFFRIDLLPANQADDATPTFLPAGSTTSTTVWSASQQIDRIQLKGLPGTGSYTEVNNGWKYYNGSTWTSFSNVVASDGGDPDGVFKRAGNVTISWDYPSPWLWKKAELSIGGTLKGPDYWFGLEYASTLVAQTGNDLTTYPAKWRGRLFEVIEVSPKPGGAGRMPYIEAVLQEVM